MNSVGQGPSCVEYIIPQGGEALGKGHCLYAGMQWSNITCTGLFVVVKPVVFVVVKL